MDTRSDNSCLWKIYKIFYSFLRLCLFRLLATGPIPEHIAFIMDGNRRFFCKKQNLKSGVGHRFGYLSLMSMLEHCCDLGIKYVTVYAFSIDNFNRKQDEVKGFMDLMLEKAEEMLKEDSIIYEYNIKVKFIGNLNLLNEPVRIAVDRVMAATSGNTKRIFSICVAYTCTDEIVHAVQESYQEKWAKIQRENLEGVDSEEGIITVTDLERHMYMAGCPDPDILIRTSGETRLSNFLLWQTTFCYLLTPNALWPEISLKHLVWEILKYQRVRPYLEKKKNDGEFSK